MISSNSDSSLSPLILRAPLRLVQIWVWERFPPPLRRNPNSVGPGESRMARWHNKQKFYITNVRSAVDSAGKSFKWCPYVMVLDNLSRPIFSVEKEEWVSVGLDLNEEIESFARCLRVCDLVGIDCMEQYLPHRVAMQFGFDQDIPGSVSSSSSNPETAWKNYSRPIGDLNFVILSRLFESHVTTRYLEWRKKSSVSTNQGVGGTNAGVSLNALRVKTKIANSDNFPSKCRRVEVKGGPNNIKDANKKKHLGDGGKPTSNDNPLVSGKSECLSPSNANSGKAELVVKAVKEEIQESEVSKGVTETVGGDGADSRHGRGRNNSIWFESAAFELEARISKLEKIVAGLKASRFGNRVV